MPGTNQAYQTFFEYSLKIPRIYSNISLSDRRRGLLAEVSGQVHRQPCHHDLIMTKIRQGGALVASRKQRLRPPNVPKWYHSLEETIPKASSWESLSTEGLKLKPQKDIHIRPPSQHHYKNNVQKATMVHSITLVHCFLWKTIICKSSCLFYFLFLKQQKENSGNIDGKAQI